MSTEQVMAMAQTNVTTVVPRAFGVKSIDGSDPLAMTDPVRARKIVLHLLPANTPLPADTGPYTFYTAIDNQRVVEVEIWEQTGAVESPELDHNHRIGRGLMRMPPRLKAMSPLDVTFVLSETGTLSVQAVEPASHAELRFELTIGGLAEADLATARKNIAGHRVSG
jgi:molecular chaperone DnaK (HSP70)